jgi:sterol desaturase/sphingolipid hydroxylase (fatty acid hydroxylase superfamily)
MTTQTLPTSIREAVNPEWLPWLVVALAVVMVAATVEGLVLSWRRPGSYDWRAYFSSIADALIRRAVDALGLSIAAPLFVWAWQHRLATLPLNQAASFLLLFIGQEFFYYWHHRAAHRVRWFWATHAVHHSPNQLSLATAVRLGWTGKISGSAIFFVPLVWLGFPPAAVLGALALNLLYQFWIHATWIPKLWWPIEWLLNTPSHHRVHHASNREYLDCNYGGVLIVFDRLFGSFVEERADIAPRYGLTVPLTSYNPLRIALHEWVNLGRDFIAARSWRTRWLVLFGRPGVRPATLTSLVLCMLVVLSTPPAQAQTYGSLGLASDNIERGVSQSDRKPSANATLGWRGAGAYVSLGAATVSKAQYVGSDGYKLMPELGYAQDLDANKDWRASLALRGQIFPGATGPWFGKLPARLQTANVQAKQSNYSTAEIGATLAWKTLMLSVSRSLTDYLGLAATETGPLGTRVIESKGTTYFGVDVEWPIVADWTLNAGVGRLQVPNFDGLSYTDWRLGGATQTWGPRFALQASGSNANGNSYRLRRRGGDAGTGAASTRLSAFVSWSF